MPTISTVDLTSELIDLTDVPLRRLRDTTTTQLVCAVRRAVAVSTANGNEVQEQSG